MIKLRAILRLLFSKRFVLQVDDGKRWWFMQENMRIKDIEYTSKFMSDSAKDELDGHMAVYQAEQILKR